MRTYADNVLIELPGAWDNDSSYVYRRVADDIEVHIEHAPTQPGATPDGILDDIEARMKKLPGLMKARRSDVAISSFAGRALSVESKGPSDKEASRMEALVLKVSPTRSVIVTATAPARSEPMLSATWKQIQASLRVVNVD